MEGMFIPKDIWEMEDVSITEKVFLAEIKKHKNNGQYCTFDNLKFSELTNLSPSRCSTILNKLARKGYINIELERHEVSGHVERRLLTINL